RSDEVDVCSRHPVHLNVPFSEQLFTSGRLEAPVGEGTCRFAAGPEGRRRCVTAARELFCRVDPDRGRFEPETRTVEGEHIPFDIKGEHTARDSKRVRSSRSRKATAR